MKLGTIIYVDQKSFRKIHAAADQWAAFCECFQYDERFPKLLGGLDHVSQTKNQITFHDIGVNYNDNSFTIRVKKEASISFWCAKCGSPKVKPGEYCWNCGTLNESGLCQQK